MLTVMISSLLLLSSGAVAQLSPSPTPSASAHQTSEGEQEVTLRPVVTEGTAIEALKYDAILPDQSRSVRPRGANGAITKELQNSLPFHFADPNRAGSATSITGSVRGAEEIDVNVLGVPLNFPQGGGFYLQSLPQYLWSGYTFQFGPAMGAFDPRGVAGSLNLRLWSADAILSDEPSYEAGALHSTQDIQQFYFGASPSRNFGGRVGWSTGQVKGPGASISARLMENDTIAVKFHAIGSKQEAIAFQSERSDTATANYTTSRGIPLIQADVKLGRGLLLKNTAFYDNSYLRTEDPENTADDAVNRERAHVYQGGIESALVGKNFRVGFGARQTDYHRLEFAAPTERLLNVQGTYTFHPAERLTIEPTLGGVAVSRIGFNPMATLGTRYELEDKRLSFFNRIGYHNRVPSLLDRYYSLTLPGLGQIVAPNPDLRVERVFSVEIGPEYKDSRQRGFLTLFARYSKDARFQRPYVIGFDPGPPPGPVVETPTQIINNGDAYVFGVWQSFDREMSPYLTLGARSAFTRARFKTARQAFLYQPELVGIAVADLHDADRKVALELANRASTGYFGAAESDNALVPLPGYYYLDLTVRVRPLDRLELMAGIENAFDRQIQFRLNQGQNVGRFYVMSASYQF